MRTLHLYFARELLKTFFMTTLALTLLVVMGGGVANIFKGEGIGADDVALIFAFLTPVAITLILPIAALFSATICYGRAAADNEVIACRAAGINIQRLLLSAGTLGLFVTLFTYWSWNFMIPSLSQKIEDITRRELHAIVLGQFQKAKPLTFGKYRMMASRCDPVPPEQVALANRNTHTYLLLTGVSFIEVEDQEVMRFGTAETTTIDFDHADRSPRVKAFLENVRSYDKTRRQYYEFKQQIIGPYEVPVPLRRKIKFENLPTLLEYKQHPEIIPDVEARVAGLRRTVMTFIVFDDVVNHLDPDRKGEHKYVLTGDKIQYELSREQLKVNPENGKPTLGNVRVEEKILPDGPRRIYNSDTALFELRTGITPDSLVVMVELKGNVGVRRVPHLEGERMVKKDIVSLQPAEFMDQPSLKEHYGAVDIAALLKGNSASLTMPPDQTRQLGKLCERVQQIEGEVNSEIHFRASYAFSVIAMILLGATLGIIVRGGQVLTAFGISCVPVMFVVMACIIGRNLADRPKFASLSVGIMWGAAICMYLAFGFVATKVLRR